MSLSIFTQIHKRKKSQGTGDVVLCLQTFPFFILSES